MQKGAHNGEQQLLDDNLLRFYLLGFLTHIKYSFSIENWVWQCWESLARARTLTSVVAACNLTSSRHWSLISSVDISQARVPWCGHRILSSRWCKPLDFMPSHCSSLSSSLDYRREPILLAELKYHQYQF